MKQAADFSWRDYSNRQSHSKELVCGLLVSVFISKCIVTEKSLLVQFKCLLAPRISYSLCGFEVKVDSRAALRRNSTRLSVSSTDDVLLHLVSVCNLSYGPILYFVFLIEASLNWTLFLCTGGGTKSASKHILRLYLGHVSLVSWNAALYHSIFLVLFNCHLLDFRGFDLLTKMVWFVTSVAWQGVCSACLFVHFFNLNYN